MNRGGVRVAEPDAMHIAGLVLARVVGQALRAGGAAGLPGNVAIDADGMAATLVPRADGLVVERGVVAPLATVTAPLPTLLALCEGGSLVRAWFSGLRARGSLRALLALRRLLAAARREGS